MLDPRITSSVTETPDRKALRFTFRRDGDEHVVHLAGTDESHAFRAADVFNRDDYAELRWYLEEYLDLPAFGFVIRAERVEKSLLEWGRAAYRALFEEFPAASERLKIVLAGGRGRLVIASSDPEILRIPWELTGDDEGPLVSRELAIVRQLEHPEEVQRPSLSRPLRILLVIARPDDVGFIDPRSTAPAMLDALESLADDVTVDFCRPATFDAMSSALSEAIANGKPYHVVHFDGHGSFLAKLDVGGLCFEKAQKDLSKLVSTDFRRADHLGELFTAHKVPLVILEACRSGQVGETTVAGVVASRLLEAGVGSVLCMSFSVHVAATRILMESFYRHLAQGRSVADSCERARTDLRAHPKRWTHFGGQERDISRQDWFLPQIYLRNPDLPIALEPAVDEKPASGGGRVARHRMVGFPPPPDGGFLGRGKELIYLERVFLSPTPCVLLFAMGGMGKTALAREAAEWLVRTGVFPDGAVYVSLDQQSTPETMAVAIAESCEALLGSSATSEDSKERVTRILKERRLLVVIDSFEYSHPSFANDVLPDDDARQRSEELLGTVNAWTAPGDLSGRILVASRTMDLYLPHAFLVFVQGFSRVDARRFAGLVTSHAGLPNLDLELSGRRLDRLLAGLGRHPLSIKLVVPHLGEVEPAEVLEGFACLPATFTEAPGTPSGESLLGSVDRSLCHLSDSAREMTLWLAMFRGGVFEQLLLEVSGTEWEEWTATRWELEQTGLVYLDWSLMLENRPHLQLHPTLPIALTQVAGARPLGDDAESRFIDVYASLLESFNRRLLGRLGTEGLDAIALEEWNIRRGIRLSFRRGEARRAVYMSETYQEYLKRAGRLEELDDFLDELQSLAADHRDARVDIEIAMAQSLPRRGNATQAIERLMELVAELESKEEDCRFSIASALRALGSIYLQAGASSHAIEFLERAISIWSELVEESDDRQLPAERSNLAAAWGSYANALRLAGRMDDARTAVSHTARLCRELGHPRDIAVSLAQEAGIYTELGLFDAAASLFGETLKMATSIGDQLLVASTLQSLGYGASRLKKNKEARKYLKDALALQLELGDESGAARTANMMGMMDREGKRINEARAWFLQSKELAERADDTMTIGHALNNLGILERTVGFQALNRGDAAGRGITREAISYLDAARRIWTDLENDTNLAASLSQLATAHLGLGEYKLAEEAALKCLEIDQRHHNREEILEDRRLLAKIRRAAGKEEEATSWPEGAKPMGGRESEFRFNEQQIAAIASTALVFAKEALGGEKVSPQERAMIAEFCNEEEPFGSLGRFCVDLGRGQLPDVPPGLQEDFRLVLEQVIQQVRRWRKGD